MNVGVSHACCASNRGDSALVTAIIFKRDPYVCARTRKHHRADIMSYTPMNIVPPQTPGVERPSWTFTTRLATSVVPRPAASPRTDDFVSIRFASVQHVSFGSCIVRGRDQAPRPRPSICLWTNTAISYRETRTYRFYPVVVGALR